MIAVNRKQGRAMAEQVSRVNQKSVFEEVAEMRAQIERLTNLLQEEREARIESQRVAEGYRQLLAGSDTRHKINGRPVLTVGEAAAMSGVSIYTGYRYLSSGHWEGVLSPRRYVYADQPLSKKRQ